MYWTYETYTVGPAPITGESVLWVADKVAVVGDAAWEMAAAIAPLASWREVLYHPGRKQRRERERETWGVGQAESLHSFGWGIVPVSSPADDLRDSDARQGLRGWVPGKLNK